MNPRNDFRSYSITTIVVVLHRKRECFFGIEFRNTKSLWLESLSSLLVWISIDLMLLVVSAEVSITLQCGSQGYYEDQRDVSCGP